VGVNYSGPELSSCVSNVSPADGCQQSEQAVGCRDNGERDNLGDPDLLRLGTVYCTQHPQFGVVRQLGPLVRLAAAARAHRRHAPLLGEHTDEVLAELGFSSGEIKGLRERGIVR